MQITLTLFLWLAFVVNRMGTEGFVCAMTFPYIAKSQN